MFQKLKLHSKKIAHCVDYEVSKLLS